MESSSCVAGYPGVAIKKQLNTRGMSQKEFAARMDISEKHISKLVNGEVQLTPDMAERLEIVLGVPARVWNELEMAYRERLSKMKVENAMDVDKALAKQFPYEEMAKYGWIPETQDLKERASNLRKYFEVVELSLLESRRITRIACRKLSVREESDLSFLAWVQEVRIRARKKETESIDIKRLINNIPDIRRLTLLKPQEFYPSLAAVLKESGIALVYLPQLKGVPFRGASFLEGNKIVVGLTVREDEDLFWFSFLHELAHIILGHISQADGTSLQDEKEADLWARNILES